MAHDYFAERVSRAYRVVSFDFIPEIINFLHFEIIHLCLFYEDIFLCFSGSMLGPTFSWIIAEQFKALKDGDRFFFSHDKGPSAKGLPKIIQVRLKS